MTTESIRSCVQIEITFSDVKNKILCFEIIYDKLLRSIYYFSLKSKSHFTCV